MGTSSFLRSLPAPKRASAVGDGGGTAQSGVLQNATCAAVEEDRRQSEGAAGSEAQKHANAARSMIERPAIALRERAAVASGEDAAAALASTLEKTRKALAQRANSALGIAQSGAQKPRYVRYCADESTPGFTKNAAERTVRLMDAQRDPMEPPRFAMRKAPPRPPSPPAPVVHSPERRQRKPGDNGYMSAADWKIPPCVSHWKNRMGYTVALEHRLAASGAKGSAVEEARADYNGKRFGALAESLYEAERMEREAVAQRAKAAQALRVEEKQRREQELKELAEEARAGRGVALHSSARADFLAKNTNRTDLVEPDIDTRVYDRAARGSALASDRNDEAYAVYETPLFAAGAQTLYAPKPSAVTSARLNTAPHIKTQTLPSAAENGSLFRPIEFERAPPAASATAAADSPQASAGASNEFERRDGNVSAQSAPAATLSRSNRKRHLSADAADVYGTHHILDTMANHDVTRARR